ncbi:MAG TPA: sucrase ferredoxin [Nocardioidaceae bacterium]|nr:sucrase ferredoxin [Nocardioidaceae bacterium]
MSENCSVESERVGEQLAGSAPYAVAWVALEQNGPWGAKAFTASHLDRAVGREIEARAAAYDIRPSLIRRPGRHADEYEEGARRLLVAYTVPGRTWLVEGCIDSPEQVVDLDWEAIAAGEPPAFLERTDRPHLLVCTNGTRDVCCATRGRPIAAAAYQGHPEQVWEVTHTSGHRFAPTAVVLPFGTLHGRLVDGSTLLAAAARGETILEGSRGRSTWPAPAQVAELAVRELIGELALDALTLAGDVVRHIDGRAWQVRTEARETGVERAESCGKALVPMAHVTVDIREATGE